MVLKSLNIRGFCSFYSSNIQFLFKDIYSLFFFCFRHNVLCFFNIRFVANKALFKGLVSLLAIEAIIFSHLPRFLLYVSTIKIEHPISAFWTLHPFTSCFFFLIFPQYFISLVIFKTSTPFVRSRNSTEAF